MKFKSLFFSLFLISSFGIYSQEEIDIDLLIENAKKTITQDSIKEVKKEKMKKAWDNRPIIPKSSEDALFFGITNIVGDDYNSYDLKQKYEIGYFGFNSDYIGFQFAIRSSDLVYDDDGDLYDSVWNLVYAKSLSDNGGILDGLFLNIALGYHSYNYDTTESFGAFYDIGGKFYAAAGIKMFLFDLGGFGIIPELNFDIDGNMTFGVGASIEL
mgnify:FL=1|tara:strand:- start:1758 stop:2396 length:639 start_codon:yes stop_codon:yes gene_type:complete